MALDVSKNQFILARLSEANFDHTLHRFLTLSSQEVGVSKGVKRLLKSSVPDLSRFNDISDFVLRCVHRGRLHTLSD